jgi:predicted ATPase
MRYEGEGLASVLYFLDRTRDPRLDQIVEAVSSAVDGFGGFEFNAVANDFVGFSGRFTDSRGVVEAPNLSAGTLSLIGWLTLLIRGDRQPVLMLEEPELGLPPRSTRAVYDAALRAALAAQTKMVSGFGVSTTPRVNRRRGCLTPWRA